MPGIGVYIELKDEALKQTALEVLTLAAQSGEPVTAVLFSADASRFVETLKDYGIRELVQITGLAAQDPDAIADNLAKLIADRALEYFLAAHTAAGRDLLPRVASRLEAPLVSDCVAVDFKTNTAVKPVFAGRALSHIQLTGAHKLFTLRPNTVPPQKAVAAAAPTVTAIPAVPSAPLSVIKEVVRAVAKRIDLTEARIIISGGRGMKTKENFALLEKAAGVLGAAVGASRAAVDSGFAPVDMQVGQTGKTVNPVLYIACGISGAIQHLAGMKTAKVIVAINKDPEAPIFKKADYGIVGDLFEVLPLLTEELKKVIGK